VRPAPRHYSAGEQRADRCVHWLGMVLALGAVAGLLRLTLPQGNGLLSVSIALYGNGLLAMMVCSTLCNHDLTDQSPYTDLLWRLDHSAIFLMIAGTYSPFTLILIGGPWGWGLFAFVWTTALVGIGLRMSRAGPLRPLPYITVYLLMSWSILIAARPLLSVAPPAVLILLLLGGLLYTVGVVFYLGKRIPHHLAIWHSLIIAAAACHYAAIVLTVQHQSGKIPV